MQPLHVPGFQTGLQLNIQSDVIPDDGFQHCHNAYVENGILQRRLGLETIGRLRRSFTSESLGNTSGNPTTKNIFTVVGITETNAELAPGTVNITIGANTYQDNGDGTFTLSGVDTSATESWIDYTTGDISLGYTGGVAAISADFSYFPSLPVMGIYQRDETAINKESSLIFDTTYAYTYNNTDAAFNELPSTTPTTWSGANNNFFWGVNYRGINPQDTLFWATNFVADGNNPIRYYDGITWADFTPLVSSTTTLYQARMVLPYYGRLVALNVYEGATGSAPGTWDNIPFRAVASQIGNPLEADAWRRDSFGKGIFIDAPTAEHIVTACYYQNTLIVFFERSTWELAYVGEYGIPFVWNRINSDHGSESTFSSISFDEGALTIGEKAIVAATSSSVNRVDDKIKDLVFNITNENNGTDRVVGSREYQKEFVYWSYGSAQEQATFPNRVLAYNYRENTWSIFRDNVTFFGPFQEANGVSWDSLTTSWDDETVYWDDFDQQRYFPFTASGNQQGWVHKYNQTTVEAPSLTITAIDRTTTPVELTSVNHNLETGDIIYLENAYFVNESTGAVQSTSLTDTAYEISVIDNDTFSIAAWDDDAGLWVENFTYTPASGTGTYKGGDAALLPRLDVVTKDFNPFLPQGRQTKFVKAQLTTTTSPGAEFTVNTFSDTSEDSQGNVILQRTVETGTTATYDVPNSRYATHAYHALTTGQLIRLQFTWDDAQMNDSVTQRSNWTLNNYTLWFRPGGKIVF